MTALVVSGSLTLTLLVWSAAVPSSASRADYLIPLLQSSLVNFSSNLPLVVYSALGVIWIFWVGAIVEGNRRDRFLLTMAIAIPLLATGITLDQTRVAVCVGSLVILSLTMHGLSAAEHLLTRLGCARPYLWLGLLAGAAPSVEVTFAGHPRAPFGWIAEQLGLRQV